ncbi:hypothetical protein HYZ99_03270 [Candidatus Peregrinibacteria bacterium]|nr:hypothetical protein [Candidatus Peregrinibacteria bacterium]
MKRRHFLTGAALVFTLVLGAMMLSPRASATTTAPLKHVYNGHLLNSSGDPITSAHKVRFSYWKSADYVSGDVTATGAINTSASNYASWYEVFTVTPDSRGYFSVQLGSGTALPTIDSVPVDTLTSLFLQVEVKASTAADTAYELLDRDANDASVDRSPVLSVPSALNADMIDRRDVGTGSGAIPVLESGGLLRVDQIAGGTDRNRFTIDADNTMSSTGSVVLRFGTTLDKTLSYDAYNSRFDFNSALRVQGNLTVTGLINGVDINAISSATNTHLRVSSGAGLKINIAAGGYRLNGNIVNYAGASNQDVANSATNYVFLTSTGLIIRTYGFPTNISYIPLAEVATSGGSITAGGVTDRRALSSDDREKTTEVYLHAQYPGAAYGADGSSNVGQLWVNGTGSLRNHYVWTSTKTSLQDYDINIRATIPSDFIRWKDNPLAVTYASSSTDTAKNKMDIFVYDTAGAAVTLSGSTTDLASISFATTQVEFSAATWTAGQDFIIKLRLYAKDTEQMKAADIKLQWVELLAE